MKLVRLSSWGMCAVVLALLATASAPQHKSNPINSLAKPFDRSSATTQPPGNIEWETVGQWLHKNECELRFKFVNGMPEGRIKDRAKELIVRRVHQIEQINDVDRKKAFIAELQAQDKIFSAQIQFRRKSPEAMANMKKAVANLLDAQIAEKTVQLNHIKTEVAELQVKRQDHLDAIAQGYLSQAQNRPHILRSSGQLGAGNEGESSDADVKP